MRLPLWSPLRARFGRAARRIQKTTGLDRAKGAMLAPLKRTYVFASGLAFQARRRFRGFEISDQPWLDPEAREYFALAIREGGSYLEFGCGGSTISALKAGCFVVSVESDKYYLRSLERKVAATPDVDAGRCRLLYANIGPTAWWGMPPTIVSWPFRSRWPNYASAPWSSFESGEVPWPNTVLVDGRFRVACVLECMLRLPQDAAFDVLVDDFASRPEYEVLAQVADVKVRTARMAILGRPPLFDREAATRLLRKYYFDPR